MLVNAKRVIFMGVLVLLGLGLLRAAVSRFHQTEETIRKACQAELAKLGVPRNTLKSKYPTPEIKMVSAACLLPGQTGEVVVTGKFAAGTKFVLESDSVEVLNESLTPTEYRASVKAAAGIGPETAGVWAISPVTGIEARAPRAVIVSGGYEWSLTAANGWKVIARALASRECGQTARGDGDPYEVQFFKKGEANPFERRKATLNFSIYNDPHYGFRISDQSYEVESEQDELLRLAQKAEDRTLSAAERAEARKALQEIMRATQARMSDPAYFKNLEARKQQFGCEGMYVDVQAGAVKGHLRCAKAVGIQVGVTGGLKLLAQ